MNLRSISEHWPIKLKWLIAGSGGIFVGMSAYLAHLSNATSYMSDDPKACINCHIMNPEYASWKHSSHANVTTCNDCHVPHDSWLSKMAYKAKDGIRHSTVFTLRGEPQVLKATEEAKHVIQANCVRCHTNVISQAKAPVGHSIDRNCIECHREVPHGRVHSLSATPNAALPPVRSVVPDWMKRNTTKEQNSERSK